MSAQIAIEEWVICACQELGLAIANVDDDFFDAGATSLTIMRLIDRIEKKFGSDVLTPEEVVERSSVREIAAAIAGAMEDRALAPAED